MTVQSKRLLSQSMTAVDANLVHGAETIINDTWIPQIDVTVVGVELIVTQINEALGLAEAGGGELSAEVTRGATIGDHSRIAKVIISNLWQLNTDQGAITDRSERMFPEGYGIDIDSGEAINLLTRSLSHQAAVDTMGVDYSASIFYVQR